MQVEVRRSNASFAYAELDQRQREIAERVRAGGEGALLLSELEPVITMGRRAQPGDLLLSERELEARGISVFRTDRGGLATYHGPGQWVLFAVDRLDRLTGDRRGVRAAVEALLEAARETAQSFGVSAEIREGAMAGVWSSRGAKLASVGVYVQDGVLLHGLALNVFRTSASFMGLRPCGLDAAVAFLDEEVRALDDQAADLSFEAVGERLIEVAREAFARKRARADVEFSDQELTPPAEPETSAHAMS
jgi:lipoyl(octanoyl) transferase